MIQPASQMGQNAEVAVDDGDFRQATETIIGLRSEARKVLSVTINIFGSGGPGDGSRSRKLPGGTVEQELSDPWRLRSGKREPISRWARATQYLRSLSV